MLSLKTLRVRIRRFMPGLLCTLVFLALLEGAFRAGGWFYDYGGWESPGLQKKMERADDLFARTGHIDLVTLSTSVGRVMDVNQWEDATSNSLVAYNYGFPDQRPERQNFLFQKYIYPRFKPKYVIYGLSLVDVNSNVRGKHPDRPKRGPFWSYRQVQALRAHGIVDRALAFLDEHSYLFRSRHRARFSLQYGEIAMLPGDPTVGRGVLAPTIRRQPFGPMPKSWALDPAGMQYNAYHHFWAPPGGEIGEVIELGQFCQGHGVKFAVVEFPGSPYAHTNFDNGKDEYWKFTEALDLIEAAGIPVFPMARELPFDNTHFEDQEHLNRWGGQMVTDYVYDRIVRPWLKEKMPAERLQEDREFSLAEVAMATTPTLTADDNDLQAVDPGNGTVRYNTSFPSDLHVRAVEPAVQGVHYESLRQVAVDPSGKMPVTIPIAPEPVSPGPYTLELYGGDGTTTSLELKGAADVTIVGRDVASSATAVLPVEKWVPLRSSVSYTQAWFSVGTTSTLQLEIRNRGRQPFILDTAFIRPRYTVTPAQTVVD